MNAIEYNQVTYGKTWFCRDLTENLLFNTVDMYILATAIANFQNKNGLEPDGKIGPQTLATLKLFKQAHCPEMTKIEPLGLTPRDLAHLQGVDESLVSVVKEVATLTRFSVLEGLRSEERQRQLVAEGKSQTLHSKHLVGRAVDLGPIPLDWDNLDAFRALSVMVKRAAKKLNIAVNWGGDWRTFYDGPHYELKD